MRKSTKFLLSLAVLLQSFVIANGQKYNASKAPLSGTILYSGTRLTYPLVEAWANAFNKLYPDVSIKVLAPGQKADTADLKVLAYTLKEEDLKSGEQYFVATNYAQLPIANSKHPLLAEWLKNGITEKELKSLYYKTDQPINPKYSTVNIYKRETNVCAAKTFSEHFGTTFSNSRGVGVKGDDRSLIESTRKDPNGISYNNLGFIYDVNTRKVIEGISVIPIDFNENGKLDPEENIYSNLDVLISKIETGTLSQITVDKVNLVTNQNKPNQALDKFLEFVKKDGQTVIHQYGFVTPNPQSSAKR